MGRVPELVLSPDGGELTELAGAIPRGGRHLIGIAGAPGSGKSTVAAALVEALGSGAVCVPMDGYHLADVQLACQGLADRKGAPETFDVWGYASLLGRLREHPPHPVYAPGFDRELEQPVAGTIAVTPEHDVVVTEGNYLLLDEPGWCAARSWLHEVWYVRTDPVLRTRRLIERHVRYGKPPDAAATWVSQVDEPNARRVLATATAADRVIDLTRWNPC